ncbi:MAG TPA: tRNA (adenosine(37)-N6)-dimethylallyltransferase MiaA, partial [Myxococcales bacterium]|nr:tRNA (adenosine(37)-N6)-dimethylallyltransferase MiaA [Myxococcales bacterium]
ARQTRRYAKRQLTWFRKEPGAQLIRPPYPELR